MQMTAEMDTGPIVAQAKVEIEPEDWPPPASILTDLLFTEGGNLLAETLPLWIEGKVNPVPQNNLQATFTKKFNDEESIVDLSPTADQWQQFLKIRAFDRNPRVHFFAEQGGLPAMPAHAGQAGKRLRVNITEASWKDGRLVIEKVIPEGKKEMDYQDFLRSGAQPVIH